MSVMKRGRASYRVTIELPRDAATGKRVRRVFSVKGNKKQAEAAEREELYRIEHGVDVPPDKLTVGAWITQWLDGTAAERVKGTTLRRYRSIGARLTGILGPVRLQQLRPAHIEAAYAKLRDEKIGAQTLQHYHRMLHSCLKTALRLQLIATNPSEAVTPPRVERHEAQALTPEQLERLVASITDQQLRRIVEVTAGTGMRIGEVLALRWSDLDLDGAKLRVDRTMVYTPREGISYSTPKTKAGRRSISLAPTTLKTLSTQRKAQVETRLKHADTWEDGDNVWSDDLGRAVPPYMVSKPFSKIASDLGFEGFTFHGLRHTHATLLLRGGVPDVLAAARLGHANANVTRAIYQHVQPDLADGVADVVERLIVPAMS